MSVTSEEQLLINMVDLFTAGSETTSTTLTWTLINLIHNPEIQKKVHDEIDHVLGSSQPTLEYKGRLVFIFGVLVKLFYFNSSYWDYVNPH